MLSMSSAAEGFHFPWCQFPLEKVDNFFYEIRDEDRQPRLKTEDLTNCSFSLWQKCQNRNKFYLSNFLSSINSGALFVPPPLHLKLVLVNKIVESLDLMVRQLDDMFDIEGRVQRYVRGGGTWTLSDYCRPNQRSKCYQFAWWKPIML